MLGGFGGRGTYLLLGQLKRASARQGELFFSLEVLVPSRGT